MLSTPSYWDCIRSSSLSPKFLVFFPSKQLYGHLLRASEKDLVRVSNTHTIRQVSGLPVFHKREQDGLQTARQVGLQAKIEYCTTSESQSVVAPCEYSSPLWAASLTPGGSWYDVHHSLRPAASDDGGESDFVTSDLGFVSKNVALLKHVGI